MGTAASPVALLPSPLRFFIGADFFSCSPLQGARRPVISTPEPWRHSPPCLHTDITLQPPSGSEITPGMKQTGKAPWRTHPHRHSHLCSHGHVDPSQGPCLQPTAGGATSWHGAVLGTGLVHYVVRKDGAPVGHLRLDSESVGEPEPEIKSSGSCFSHQTMLLPINLFHSLFLPPHISFQCVFIPWRRHRGKFRARYTVGTTTGKRLRGHSQLFQIAPCIHTQPINFSRAPCVVSSYTKCVWEAHLGPWRFHYYCKLQSQKAPGDSTLLSLLAKRQA